jgi:diguanylate cyclase (GGDEF)-like protein
MQPGFDRDYRYLLSQLIPRHRLSPMRREGIRSALADGNRFQMVREAYLSMEELAGTGVFSQDGVERQANAFSISYRNRDYPSRITLVMTEDEWLALARAGEKREGILPSVLAGIISSLSLNDSHKTVSTRIEEMLSLAGSIQPGSVGRLLFINGFPSAREWANERIAFMSRREVSKRRFYSSYLEGNNRHTFIRVAGEHAGESAFALAAGTKSVLMMPLGAQDERMGILEIHLSSGTPPDENAISNFHILGQGIVRLLDNNRHLEKMVSIDRLTQVHNRNHYEFQLPLEMERANRNGKSFAFLIIDIDDFKKVNDDFGHDVGDTVLKLIAQTIRRSLRKIDLLFRYGGEEFIVLLPGAGVESAQRTAERIREVVSRLEHVSDDGRRVKVTISLGGSIYPEHAQNEKQLFRMADKALYRAKEEGKNRVAFCEP